MSNIFGGVVNSNYVTLNTEQNITGAKRFYADLVGNDADFLGVTNFTNSINGNLNGNALTATTSTTAITATTATTAANSLACSGNSFSATTSTTAITATTQATTDNSTNIATTAFVQSAISVGGTVNPTNWIVANGNLQNNAHLNNASKQCMMNIRTSIPFSIITALSARFEFQYSCYGTSAYNATNSCSTAGTLNLCANNVVNNPNTITQFDIIYGYNGGSSSQAEFRVANIQTTSAYWNTQQTYIPKNATATSWPFTPLSFTFTFSGTNPNHITFNIGFPQNPSLMGANPVGDMMCCTASLRVITSPPSGAGIGYLLDTITSTNTTGSWSFA